MLSSSHTASLGLSALAVFSGTYRIADAHSCDAGRGDLGKSIGDFPGPETIVLCTARV